MVTLNGFFKDYEFDNRFDILLLTGDQKIRFAYIEDVLELYGNCPIYYWHIISRTFVIAIIKEKS